MISKKIRERQSGVTGCYVKEEEDHETDIGNWNKLLSLQSLSRWFIRIFHIWVKTVCIRQAKDESLPRSVVKREWKNRYSIHAWWAESTSRHVHVWGESQCVSMYWYANYVLYNIKREVKWMKNGNNRVMTQRQSL